MEKRKAAANVFLEQQTKSAEEEEIEEFEDLDMASGPEEAEGSILSQDEVDQLLSGVGPAPEPKTQKRSFVSGIPFSTIKSSEEMQLEKEPTKVRETGLLFWRRIIVPPNAYVVHTRINKEKPVTLGLGISFRYNPNADAFLVVPAAMQTIGVVANCITEEKQGINVLAYVQWQIDDFSIAYRKLDFSDSRDPLGIINAQLGEQAEAAIKDKIATMSVEEVLTDKAPIIEELTARLKLVAEGQHQDQEDGYEGLGIKIATVQIREALVSSQSLWTDLQSPFRHEQKKTSRISYLDMQNEINKKELETRKLSQTNEAETYVEIERTKQQKQTEGLELKLKEEATRFAKEQEATQNKLHLEEQTSLAQAETRDRLEEKENEIKLKRGLEIQRQESEKSAEERRLSSEAARRQVTLEMEGKMHALTEEARLNLTRLEEEMKRLEGERVLKEGEAELRLLVQSQGDALEEAILKARMEREGYQHGSQLSMEGKSNLLHNEVEERKVKLEQIRQEIRNLMNDRDLLSQLIEKLPQIAAEMPKISEMKVLQTGGDDHVIDTLAGFLSKAFSIAEVLEINLPGRREKPVQNDQDS